MNRNLQIVIVCNILLLLIGGSITMIIKGDEQTKSWENDKRPFFVSKYLGIIGDPLSDDFYYVYEFENGCTYKSTSSMTVNSTLYTCIIDVCPVSCSSPSSVNTLMNVGIILFFSAILSGFFILITYHISQS